MYLQAIVGSVQGNKSHPPRITQSLEIFPRAVLSSSRGFHSQSTFFFFFWGGGFSKSKKNSSRTSWLPPRHSIISWLSDLSPLPAIHRFHEEIHFWHLLVSDYLYFYCSHFLVRPSQRAIYIIATILSGRHSPLHSLTVGCLKSLWCSMNLCSFNVETD